VVAVGGVRLQFVDSPVAVAQRLLGQRLCRRTRDGLCAGRIVETEAYLAEGDSAAHSLGGPNRKNASMFGPAGRAYVYTIHARQCVNVVTEQQGVGSAVLIRAVEPLTGLQLMQYRRRTDRLRDLCRGPARLCEAFEIGRDLDGWDLTRRQRLWIEPDSVGLSPAFFRSARIGVTSATELPLRFFVKDSKFISGTRRQNRIDAN
jgi:DNA-3-methyladenine glycosylase